MRCAALILLVLAGLSWTGCGGSKMPPPPPPPPTRLVVHVVDATNHMPLDGASVVFVEEGKTRTTTASGELRFEIKGGIYTYRAQAPKYVSSPRPGHPIGRVFAAEHQTTDLTIKLEPRPMAPDGGTLSGRVTKQGAGAGGVLVVANGIHAYATHTDASGVYTLQAVAPGLYQITSYLGGYVSTAVPNVNLATPQDAKTGIDLDLAPNAGATVGGRTSGGTGTSSIALVQLDTGEPIPGLSTHATLGQSYSIPMVPPGRYLISATPDDSGVTYDAEWFLFRGPPSVSVSDTSSKTVDLQFAPAIAGITPATTSTVPAPPGFSWPQVQDATFYVVEVRDVVGQVIWGGFDARKNPRMPIMMTNLRYMGDPLTPGALYSWRVYAAKNVTTGMIFTLLGQSAELAGEFRISN